MLARGLAIGLSLALASVAQAGVVVNLVRTPDKGAYNAGEVVDVEVFLQQDTIDVDHFLRQIQFDLNASNPALVLALPKTHERTFVTTDDVFFWYFGSLNRCTTIPAICGEFHFLVQALNSTVNPGPGIISATYGIDNFDNTVKLARDTGIQLKLPGDGTAVKVGQLKVTMPLASGSYKLDLINAAEANADKGGQVRYGFSLGGTTETITAWKANGGQVTGGTYTFVVGGDAILNASDPACGVSWPRSANNFAKLTFDKDLVLPAAGQVQIRGLVAGGGFEADLSGNFTFSIVNDGSGQPRILRIVENGTQLTDRKWYAITNNGWAGVDAFKVDIVHLVGDADGNGRVLNADVGLINSQISPLLQPDKRTDIDGNGRVLNADVGVANSKISPLAVTKPAGHTCVP